MRRKSVKYRILAACLATSMVFTMMPMTAFAEEINIDPAGMEMQTESLNEEVNAEENIPEEETGDTTQTEVEQVLETEAAVEELNADTVSERKMQVETSGSEAIEALQTRIDALPTVDEFIALADGTTVEDSTLNQAQLDVYNEAQAIAEEMDKLTDEEQGQLDTGKLEALFEYFNSLTAETATTITPSTSGYTISSAGTYDINGAVSSTKTSTSQIYITATGDVTLNINGNITFNNTGTIIRTTKACNLTIIGNGYTIKNTNTTGLANVFQDTGGANITFKGGIYEATTDGGGPVVANAKGGTISLYDATFRVTGTADSGQAFNNSNSILNIYSGTIIDNGPVSGYACVSGGTVNMYGGTITAQAKNSAAISATNVNFTGGTIQNSKYGIAAGSSASSVTIGGSATFINNTADIYLTSGKQFTISDDFSGTASVGVADTISDNTKRQITTADTAQSMLAKVCSVNSDYAVNYDTSGKYLYLWKHSHTWSYSASENEITAKCTSDSNCKYYSDGLTLTLTAPDMTYTGSVYNKASVTDNITSVTGATAGSITYAGRGGTSYTSSTTAPTNAGKYTASVTINGKTASVDFEITKASVEKPSADGTTFVYNENSQTYNIASNSAYTVTGNTRTDAGTQTVTVALNKNYKWSDGSTDDLTFTFTIAKADITPGVSLADWVYGSTASTPEITGNSGNGTVTYSYKEQDADDSTYTEVTDFATIPVGSYTLKASIAESTNYNANEATCNFAVTKQPITVEVSMDGWTYGDTANTPNITDESNPGNGNVTYTYYTDAACTNQTTSENGAVADGAVPENAGTYYVKAEVSETASYSDGSAVSEFTIAKKAVTATVTAENKTYDGNTNATVSAVVESKDLVSGDSVTIDGITGTFEDQNAGTDKKVIVDSSNVRITGTGAENYAITIGTEAKASIDKRTAEFTWSNTDLTYTGGEQSVTAEVSNAISGDTFTLTYDGNKQTAVGDYTAKVTTLGNDNYELPSESDSKTDWKISYLAKGTATVSGTKGDNDWYVTKVTITPESGYLISTDGREWQSFLAYDAQGEQTVTYYLMEKETGFITDEKNESFKIDTELPTGEIKIKNNGFTGLLNTITFKYFFKNTVDVKINGTDVTSGIAKIEYQKAAKGASFDKDGIWTDGKSFSMTANDKSTIYARITDNAGNFVIINSDGIVVYTDATATAEETFTKTSAEDVTTGVTVNGNTIASVKNGDTTVAESAYEIKGDKLVLKASYLQTLAAGTYTFTVSYNPYGEVYTTDSEGDAPDTSVITLKVIGAMKVSVEGYTGTYDGQAHGIKVSVTDPADASAYHVKVTYGVKAEDGTITYSENPVTYKDAGEYTVYIKATADYYEDVVESAVVKIAPKTVSLVWSDTEFTYDGGTHMPAAEVNSKDLIGSDSVEVTVSGEQTNAGSYTAQAVALSNDNYVLGTDVNKAFVIKKAAATVTVDNAAKHIGKADPEFTYKVTGLVKGESLADITVARTEGEAAGEYDITATAKDGSNANYDVTFTAGKLTIEDHIKAEAPVVENRVEAVCTEDGSYDEVYYCTVEECKAELERVHQTIPAIGHAYGEPVFTWSEDYSSATAEFTCANDVSHVETKECTVKKEVTKQASGTEKGELTYTATVTLDEKTYEDTRTQETEVAGFEEIGANGGKITTEIIVAEDMPKTEIKNLTVEAAKTLLTDEELEDVEAGAEITIYLEAKSLTDDAVKTDDKTYVEDKLEDITEQLMQSEGLISRKQVTTGIQYIDLSLYKRIGNGTAIRLKSTGQNELEITVDIPENLKSDNSRRTYYIIRVHETDAGTEVDILPAIKTGDSLTFKTDRFSTYAIAYAEPNSYVMPAKVTLNQTEATLTSKGSTTQLTATVEPGDAVNKNVTWTSSDPGVATVDANGLVTAVANGTVTITVTTEDGGFTATATITVNIASDDDDGDDDNSDNNPIATPEDKGNETDPRKDNQNFTSPKTGDSSAMWMTLFIISCAGLAGLLVKRKKENCK